MKNLITTIKIKKIASLGAGIFIFLLYIFLAPTAQAATSTVRGVGWWGNLGEVYFNCLDDKVGDRLNDTLAEDPSGSFQYGNLYNFPEPRGFHFFVTPCIDLVHGVYIDSLDNLYGEAWNANKGLIDFSGPGTPPGGYGTMSPKCASKCSASNHCWACFDNTTQQLYGWAQVRITGEWIKLDSAPTLPALPIYLQTCSGSLNYAGPGILPGDFFGNASSPLGPLSFNCKNEFGYNTCGTRDYKVYIGNLSIGSLSAPNLGYQAACQGTARDAHLQWCTRSGTQSAYEIVISKNNILSTSTNACWTGKQNYSAKQFNAANAGCILEYGKDYYWWIRLYDEADQPTIWYQYYGNSASDTDGNRDNNIYTFSTYKHEFPSPYFTWSPFNILIGSTTAFTSAGSVYYTGAPNTATPCVGPNCLYTWSTTDNDAIIYATTSAETNIVFSTATSTTISLVIKDSDLYTCSTSSPPLKINYDLPIWREVKAQ